jgi:hypothetical protein
LHAFGQCMQHARKVKVILSTSLDRHSLTWCSVSACLSASPVSVDRVVVVGNARDVVDTDIAFGQRIIW